MISRISKKQSKRVGKSEKQMWKAFAKHLQVLLLSQNKTLYEVAHEKDRLLHLITMAIKEHLEKENG